eukprot:1916101-Amphidinium_carterae.1
MPEGGGHEACVLQRTPFSALRLSSSVSAAIPNGFEKTTCLDQCIWAASKVPCPLQVNSSRHK